MRTPGELIHLAHGIGGRSDLPVPLWLAVYGAAAAVLVSFLALVAFWKEPKLRGAQAGVPLPEPLRRLLDAPGTRAALRGLGLLLGVAVLATAWLGPGDESRNPAPTWFYVWFWIGLAALSVLLGPVWRPLNPLRTVAAGYRRLVGVGARPLPERVGYWPAAASLLGFLWLELVYDHAAAPGTVAVFLTGYALAHVTAGVRYGDRWFDRGEGFQAYSTLLGHLAPVGRRADGVLVVRNPLDGLAALRPAPGLVATVCVLLGSTGFDGVTRTGLWKAWTTDLSRAPYLLLGTVGLLGAVALILATYRLATDRPERFVASLLPIAFGYTVAHYFSLAVFQGQAGLLLASDPLGLGWDLLGVAGRAIDYAVVTPQTIALVQVGAIIAGHVAGVVSAHDAAVVVRRERQYSLVTAMVAYTMCGIVLVVGP